MPSTDRDAPPSELIHAMIGELGDAAFQDLVRAAADRNAS